MKHIVGFSGGIDSQATLRWLLNRYAPSDIIALNSEAGRNEHPYTVTFVQEYSDKVHPIVKVVPLVRDIWEGDGRSVVEKLLPHAEEELTFDRLAAWKQFFPSRKKQYCTEFLKMRPMRRWVRENITDDFERYSGIRREESRPRRERQPREWDDFMDCWLNNPLVDWTKQMCFDYIKFHGEPLNPLYTMGFNRVGCAPCVNSAKDDILNWALRFPEMIDKVRTWEQSVGKTFFAPTVPGMYMNWVDDVVAWSKTKHGGVAEVFPVLQERQSCESKYGLCE